MSRKRDLAEANFLKGYNCAQSVLIAFCDEIGMDEAAAARLASSFGGGMGQLREVCGAVSALFLIAGAAAGYDAPGDREAKQAHYAKIRALAEAFQKENGSYICRELLENAKANAEAVEHARTPAYYAERPCAKFVGDAAELAEAFLAAHPKKEA